MTGADTTMARIGDGMVLSHSGERERARRLFADVWEDIGGEVGDPLHRCALAHAMADVQDDARDELAWDLRALAAAGHLTDERAARSGVHVPVAAFYPSLQLNIAECYRKLGEVDNALEHVRKGQAAIGALPDNGYGRMIRAALDRLARRLTG